MNIPIDGILVPANIENEQIEHQRTLLRQALRYIEMQLACDGKALDKPGVQRELERVKGVSMVGTGRDIFGMVNVDLDAIRKVLGEETAVARNSRSSHSFNVVMPGASKPTQVK
jgi:hypothetical protein